ncbi:hypothetical protein BVI2075_1260016 [Burkholderia vietnamiensis]|nr:hypothetical protein BVI2075_1260016 [Burkholderia vietnamiensis]
MTHNGAMLISTEETFSIWIPHHFDSGVQRMTAVPGAEPLRGHMPAHRVPQTCIHAIALNARATVSPRAHPDIGQTRVTRAAAGTIAPDCAAGEKRTRPIPASRFRRR